MNVERAPACLLASAAALAGLQHEEKRLPHFCRTGISFWMEPPGLFSFASRHRRTLIATGAAAFVAYYAYRSLCPPQKAEGGTAQSTFSKWRAALSNWAEALSSASGSCSVVAGDLHTFLTSSNSPELPASLRQLARLLQSSELQDLLHTSASTIARGVAEVATASSSSTGRAAEGDVVGTSSLDTVIEAVLSDRGRSLLGVAVGVAGRDAPAGVGGVLGGQAGRF